MKITRSNISKCKMQKIIENISAIIQLSLTNEL